MRYLPLILCLFVLCGGMFRSDPFDGLRVVQFHQEQPYPITVQARFGDSDWIPFPRVEEGDCVAYERGLHFTWRACFDAERCTEHVRAENPVKGCKRIWRLNGTQFKASDVIDWNAAR